MGYFMNSEKLLLNLEAANRARAIFLEPPTDTLLVKMVLARKVHRGVTTAPLQLADVALVFTNALPA